MLRPMMSGARPKARCQSPSLSTATASAPGSSSARHAATRPIAADDTERREERARRADRTQHFRLAGAGQRRPELVERGERRERSRLAPPIDEVRGRDPAFGVVGVGFPDDDQPIGSP